MSVRLQLNKRNSIIQVVRSAPPRRRGTVHTIDEFTAQCAIAAARDKAADQDLCISIAISDATGHLKAFLRMDGASLISLQIAQDMTCARAVLQVLGCPDPD